MSHFTKLDDNLYQDNKTGAIGPLRKGKGRGWYVEDESRIPSQIKRKGYTNEEYNKQEDKIGTLKQQYEKMQREQAIESKNMNSQDYKDIRDDVDDKSWELYEARQKYGEMAKNPYIERKMQLGEERFNALKESNQVAKAEEDLSSLYTYRDEKNMGSLDKEPLKRYEDKYGKKVVDKAWKNLEETKDVVKGVYTDSEGLSYNQLIDKSYIGLNKGDAYQNKMGTVVKIEDIDEKGQVMHSFQTSPTTPPSYRTFMEKDVKSMLNQNGYEKVGSKIKTPSLDEEVRRLVKADYGNNIDMNDLSDEDLDIYTQEAQKNIKEIKVGNKINKAYSNKLNEEDRLLKGMTPEEYKKGKYSFEDASKSQLERLTTDYKDVADLRDEYEDKILSRYEDTSPMSEYSDTTGTGYSDLQTKALKSGAYDKRTSTELRKQLKALKPWEDELQVGDRVIKSIGGRGYAVRNKDDYDDPMTDYSAYVYGINAKSIIERAKEEGIITDVSKSKANNTKAKIERFNQRKQGSTYDTMSKRQLAEKIVEDQLSRGLKFNDKESIIQSKMKMSKSELLKYFK